MAQPADPFIDEEISVEDEPEPVDEVEVDDAAPDEEVVDYDPESGNLVPALKATQAGKELLDEIRLDVLGMFEEDWESSTDFRQKTAADMDLYMGHLRPKDWPFANCANAHVPIALENISRLQSRLVSELMDDWTNPVGVMPVGDDDKDLADLLTMHTNWQFREQIKDFRRQVDRMALSFLLIGDVIVDSYYDPVTRTNRHEVLLPDEFVRPYSYVSTQPDCSDMPHYTVVKRYYPHQLEAMRGIWEGVDELLEREPEGYGDEPEEELREKVAEVLGHEQPTDGDRPYKILVWSGWLLLPNEDRHRWCQVVVSRAADMVLSLSVHEEPDWRDKRRHERQLLERELYQQQLAAWQRRKDERAAGESVAMGQLESGPLDEGADAAALSYLNNRTDEPPPTPPDWMGDGDVTEEPTRPRMVPMHMKAHGVCLENLIGDIGMGMGRIEADFNRAANTALSQYTDSCTLANAWSIITTSNIKFPEPFSLSPGKVNVVKGVSSSELKNSIIELKPSPASQQLLELVDKFYNYGQSAVQSPNVLSGEPGKSGETYRGIATRIEQATKQLSTLAQRFSIVLKQVYENNAKLNAIFLDDVEVVQVLNHMTRKMQTVQVGRQMYERDFRIEFRSDMKFTSEATRIKEADEMVHLGMTHPILQQNLPFQYEALKRAMESRGQYDMVAMLGPRPPPQQQFFTPPQPPQPQPGKPPPQGGPPQAAPPPPQPPG